MDREYLEDYEQREKAEYERLILKKTQDGKFDFKKDKYPPDERFVKLQRPVANTTMGTTKITNIWAQIPFSGSLVVMLEALPESDFENVYFPISDIPEIIDFIKKTGRLQVALNLYPTLYEGIDYLDPFFRELRPPVLYSIPPSTFGNKDERQFIAASFRSLAEVRYFDFLKKIALRFGSRTSHVQYISSFETYEVLKLCHYSIAEDIENQLIDDPVKAWLLLKLCQLFLTGPLEDLRFDLHNYLWDVTRDAQVLPAIYQPEEIRLPCEIGKFLVQKLTYAPLGLDACKELMYNYDAYDLQRVQKSLNEAIILNEPDIVNRSAEELSEILDNIWNDKSLPRRIEGLQIGIPLSMVAIGSVAAGPIGVAGGLLAGLGYSVADKFIDLAAGGLSERLARLKTKSYQANIYNFKKKYKGKIAHP